MRIYRLFNKLSRPRSYAGQILLICFFGTHVPLITFVLWILLANPSLGGEHWDDLFVLLLATLAGTGLTFLLVNGMLAPVRVVARALGDYRQNKQVPALPRGLSDEAGFMLEQVQDALEELDLSLTNLARAAETDPLTESATAAGSSAGRRSKSPALSATKPRIARSSSISTASRRSTISMAMRRAMRSLSAWRGS